jgi:Cu+-exporting ATPase
MNKPDGAHVRQPEVHVHTPAGHVHETRAPGMTPMHQHKDPVCGMNVSMLSPYWTEYEGHKSYFCSTKCKTKFDAQPGQYSAAMTPSVVQSETEVPTVFRLPTAQFYAAC